MIRWFTLVSLGFVGVAFAQMETQEIDVKGLTTLIVASQSGHVKIWSTDSSRARIQSEKIRFGSQCRFLVDRVNEKLVVKVKRQDPGTDVCEVNMDLRVPRHVNVDVENGSGDIDVTNVEGNIKFDIGSGDATIHSDIPTLKGHSGAGNITLHGTAQEAKLSTGSGHVMLTYTKVPKVGEIVVDTGTGNTKIILPEGTKIKTHFLSANGQMTNEFPEDEDAKFRVSVEAGVGDLSITKVSQISE